MHYLKTNKKKNIVMAGLTHLPKLMTSPKRNTEPMTVIIRFSGVDMAWKTGPFLSITHACK